MLSAAGIPASILGDPNARVPQPAMTALWRHALETTGDEYLGIHLAEAAPRVHRVHHLDTELDISTTVRFHPAEFIVNLAVGIPIVVAFGLSPWVLLLYEIFDAVITLFSHANVRIPPALDRVLRYVIVTPDLHRVHHSAWQTETDSNFGAVFPVWDIVFGTFRTATREPHETMALGLEEVRDDRASRLGWLLRSPLLDRLPPE